MISSSTGPRVEIVTDDRLRLGLIGAGWISTLHLAAFDRLERTRLVGVASARLSSAEATAVPRGAVGYDDAERMLDEQRPDVVYVAVPPSVAVATCEAVIARGIPFLTEKPLAATDADGPVRVAAAMADSGLVVAVGYHLRSLEPLPEVRARLAENPARLVTARWTDSTPLPAWWRRERDGGGQVIEQATHLYDLARLLDRRGRGRRRGVPARDAGDAGRDGRRRRHGRGPALRDRRRRRVRQHPPPVEPRRRDLVHVGRPADDHPARRVAPPGLGGRAPRRRRRDRAAAGPRSVRDPGRDLPRRRRRGRPLGGGLDLRRRAAHRPPHEGRGRGHRRPG